MAWQTKDFHKTKFQTADIPTQSDYGDLIDSFADGHQDIRNWCGITAAMLDGATDVTTQFKAAIVARRAAAIHAEHRPRLSLPAGKYRISDTLDVNKISISAPDGAMILAEEVGANKEVFKFDQSDEAQWGPWNGASLENLYILGRNTPVTSQTFTTNSWGISMGAPGLIIKNVHFRNFDKAIVGGRLYSYIITLQNVWAANNNYGFWWPANGGVSGEKVACIECNFSNNNIGVYIRHNSGGGTGQGAGGSFVFMNPSIDYNITKAVDIVGPGVSVSDHNPSVTFHGGHIETSIATSGSTPRITNGGVLKMHGTVIYDEYDDVINTSFYGRTSLLGVHYAIAGAEAKGSGTGKFKTLGTTQRYGGTVTVGPAVTEAW